jgi:Fic-DOC domain mobile mystery protein B
VKLRWKDCVPFPIPCRWTIRQLKAVRAKFKSNFSYGSYSTVHAGICGDEIRLRASRHASRSRRSRGPDSNAHRHSRGSQCLGGANILQGERRVFRQKSRDLFDEGFVRDLHKKMYDRTWKWAGTFRTSNKNIGVDWTQVAVRLRTLLDNTRYQVDQSVFPADELAVRFHHQMVWIHAFPNGNGRHARLMADAMIRRADRPRFTWGGGSSLVTSGNPRARYLNALRAADQGEFDMINTFARS